MVKLFSIFSSFNCLQVILRKINVLTAYYFENGPRLIADFIKGVTSATKLITGSMHIIQLTHPQLGRRVALAEEPNLILLNKSIASSYQLFVLTINSVDRNVQQIIESAKTTEVLDYNSVYFSKNKWRILPPIDCAHDPMQCIISGTGLTHKVRAQSRQSMHENQKADHLTDSRKMYLWGEEGGKPANNKIGVQPEWFYKGNGLNLKGHGDPLVIPPYANDGGDESEIAGVYLISADGIPYRIGLVQGNEFSDHVMERKNYLYLAPSKLRDCAIGPELVLNGGFDSIAGKVNILRQGKSFWSKDLLTGESAMAHSLANLEYHHFKYQQHRIPGQLHIHFFGASSFSFGEGISLENDDEMSVSFENMGRSLVNPVLLIKNDDERISVRSL